MSCFEYINIMEKLIQSKLHLNNNLDLVDQLLNLVKWAHDGDRAVEDYRNDFKLTGWSLNKRNIVSDEILENWAKNEKEEIINKPGGFERSLPEIDELVDGLDECFKGKAAMRISAAGVGGMVCVHCSSAILGSVIDWLNKKDVTVRIVRPGPTYEII